MAATLPQLAVGYVRVSSEEQATHGLSLAEQESTLREYASRHGLHLAAVLADPGVSTGVPLASRPSGAKLVEMVRQRQVSVILATRLDRMFRNTAECLTETDSWVAAGIDVRLLDVAVDITTASGRLALSMTAVFAEHYRQQLRERVRSTFEFMHNRGVYHCGTIPFGLARVWRSEEERRASRITADYIADPERAPIVQSLFAQFLGGAGLAQLADAATASGVRGVRGATWYPSIVRQMLLNPTYAGMVGQGAPNHRTALRQAVNLVPLVTVEAWQGCQAIFATQRKGQQHCRSRAADLLFAGLVFCKACGSRMWNTGSGKVRKGTGERVPILRCSSAAYRGTCDQPGVRDADLWEQVRPELLDHLDPAKAKRRQHEHSSEAERLQRRRAEIRAILDRLMAAFEHPASNMTIDELVERRLPLEAELAAFDRANGAPPPLPVGVRGNRAQVKAMLAGIDRPAAKLLLQRTIVEVRVRTGVVAEIIWRV